MAPIKSIVGLVMRQILVGIGGEAVQPLADALKPFCEDGSEALPQAIREAQDLSWLTLELALVEESPKTVPLIQRFALRPQVKNLADLLKQQLDSDLRRAAGRELQLARQQQFIPGAALTGADLSVATAQWQRLNDPHRLLIETRQALIQTTATWEGRYPQLAQLLNQTVFADTPLFVALFTSYFRQAVAHNKDLAAALEHDRLTLLTERLESQFGGLFDEIREQQTALLGALGELHGLMTQVDQHVTTIKDEVQQMRVQMNQLLALLHADRGPINPQLSHALSVGGQTGAIKKLFNEYQQLSEEDRNQPLLLDGLGRLLMGVGDAKNAAIAFGKTARRLADQKAVAESRYNEFRALLEQRQWDNAKTALELAIQGDPRRFAPFDLQKYQLEQILGAGGFGVVYRCIHRHLQRPVAIKSLYADSLTRAPQDVFSEGRLLASLDHPAIVEITDCGFADGSGSQRPYLVMKWFDGQPLEDYLKGLGRRFTPEETVTLARSIAEGMAAAHSAGVLHRDLKPENLLVRRLDTGFALKIIDFGLGVRLHPQQISRVTSKVDRSQYGLSIAGTMRYAPPEQLGELNAPLSPASDIYAFGKTLCFVLLGTTRPTMRHWRELGDAGAHRLADLIGKCIEDAPHERPQSFAEVQKGLQGNPLDAGVTSGKAFVKPPIASSRPPLAVAEQPSASVTNIWDLAKLLDEEKMLIQLENFGESLTRWLRELISKDSLSRWRFFADRAEPNPIAQMLLGLCYELGVGMAPDEIKARSYYQKAAKKHAPSQYRLGCLEEAAGDLAAAESWFRQAAAQQYAPAQFKLGELVENNGDETAALAHYQAAADQDHLFAQFTLGSLCRLLGKSQDAIQWYRRAADHGHVDSMYQLGLLLKVTEPLQAAVYLRKASEQQHANAQFQMGQLHTYGLGVKQSDLDAARYYRQAAELGHPRAQLELAKMEYFGTGIAMNRAAARERLQRLATKGDADAQMLLKELPLS